MSQCATLVKFQQRLNSNKGTKCDIESRATRMLAGVSTLQSPVSECASQATTSILEVSGILGRSAESRACRDHRAEPHPGSTCASGRPTYAGTARGRYRPRQNQRLQAHPDEKTLAINQTLQGQRAGGRFELGSWPLRSTEPNPSVPRTHAGRDPGTTPRASSARRS